MFAIDKNKVLKFSFTCFVIFHLLSFCCGEHSKKFSIVLTFDDGPYPGYTEKILDILKKYNISSTFFVTGKHVQKYPDLVYKIWKEGHEVGLHGYNHIDYTKLTKKQILSELKKSKKIVEDIVGKGEVKYFRPPAGKYNEYVKQCCEQQGLKLVLWSVYPLDYGEKDKTKILLRIKSHKFRNYEILLLHNGIQTTVEVLEDIINFVTKSNGRFITLQQYFDMIQTREGGGK